MQQTVESLGALERRIDLTVPAASIEQEVQTRLAKLARTVKMPGFRPGKVPLKIVAQNYGAQVHAEVMNDKVGEAFSFDGRKARQVYGPRYRLLMIGGFDAMMVTDPHLVDTCLRTVPEDTLVLLGRAILARGVTRTVWAWGRGSFRKRLRLDKPVLQVATNIIFGEVQTFGVVLDVYRGMPAIYANYYGYDEVAHTEGALGNEALRLEPAYAGPEVED